MRRVLVRVLVDCCNPVFNWGAACGGIMKRGQDPCRSLKEEPSVCRWNFDKGTGLPLDNIIDQAMRNVKQITFTHYIVMRFGLILGMLGSSPLT